MNEPRAMDAKSEAGPRARRRSSTLVRIMLATAVGAGVGIMIGKKGGAPSPAPQFSPMWIALGLWIVLSIYWSAVANRASAAKSSESEWSRSLHLLMINGGLILSFWPFNGWPGRVWNGFEFPRLWPANPRLPWIGVAVATGCLVLAIWARRHLGRNWSGAVTVKEGHELVRSGPYRFVRHPIYTGAIGMHVGTALISGRLQGLLAIALISLAYVRKIRMEERVLAETFGAAFEEYRRQSRAIVPWLL